MKTDLGDIVGYEWMERMWMFLPSLIFIVFRIYPLTIKWFRGKKDNEGVRLYEDLGLLAVYSINTWFACKWFLQSGYIIEWAWRNKMYDAYPFANETVERAVYAIMHWQIAYYAAMVIVVICPPRKKDWKAMLLHHLVTLSLILLSVDVDVVRGPIFVLLIHDICDVFLQLSTLANRFKLRIRIPLFVAFTASHVILRVCIFPVAAFYSVYITAHIQPQYRRYTMFMFAVPIWALHLYWAVKCYKIVHRYLCKGKEVHDYREVSTSKKKKTSRRKKKQR